MNNRIPRVLPEILIIRAVYAQLQEAQRALVAVELTAARVAGSWGCKEELQGFTKDGETLTFDATEATRVKTAYQQDIDVATNHVKANEAALWLAIERALDRP